jgi:hypothetical protein
MFNDYFLKFTNAAEAASVIGTQEIPNEEPVLFREGCDVSVIGTMYTRTGNILTDEEGMEYYETAPIPGYHVNIRSTVEQPDLAAYDTAPTTPMRVWA